MRAEVLLALLLLSASAALQAADVEISGHTKLQILGQSLVAGDEAFDEQATLRLDLGLQQHGWTLDAAYQLIGLNGDNIAWSDDSARFFDLSHVLRENDRSVLAHRLDRLAVGYASERTVWRLGRQALTWGNGLFFTPMDLVNPFNPAAIDTEFKSGDDMLYAQFLRSGGDDIQAAVVLRRDALSGELESDLATRAVKYHGLAGASDYDVLLAEHYGARVLGIGAARSVGGAVWRGDAVLSDAAGDTIFELVANVSYAWLWLGRNVNGTLEYYYDDGKDYLAAALLIELSPLWSVTPTLLSDLSDRNALLQLVNNYSLSDNMRLLASLNVPLGPAVMGAAMPPNDELAQYAATEWSVFAQFAWYF